MQDRSAKGRCEFCGTVIAKQCYKSGVSSILKCRHSLPLYEYALGWFRSPGGLSDFPDCPLGRTHSNGIQE